MKKTLLMMASIALLGGASSNFALAGGPNHTRAEATAASLGLTSDPHWTAFKESPEYAAWEAQPSGSKAAEFQSLFSQLKEKFEAFKATRVSTSTVAAPAPAPRSVVGGASGGVPIPRPATPRPVVAAPAPAVEKTIVFKRPTTSASAPRPVVAAPAPAPRPSMPTTSVAEPIPTATADLKLMPVSPLEEPATPSGSVVSSVTAATKASGKPAISIEDHLRSFRGKVRGKSSSNSDDSDSESESDDWSPRPAAAAARMPISQTAKVEEASTPSKKWEEISDYEKSLIEWQTIWKRLSPAEQAQREAPPKAQAKERVAATQLYNALHREWEEAVLAHRMATVAKKPDKNTPADAQERLNARLPKDGMMENLARGVFPTREELRTASSRIPNPAEDSSTDPVEEKKEKDRLKSLETWKKKHKGVSKKKSNAGSKPQTAAAVASADREASSDSDPDLIDFS